MHPLLSGLRTVADHWRTGEAVALATVVEVLGSTPATVGSTVAIDTAGTITGGITAGCVESEIVANGEIVLANRMPILREFGYATSDELTPVPVCGGRLRVLIEVVDPQTWPDLPAAVALIGGGDPTILVVEAEGLDPEDEMALPTESLPAGETPQVHHLVVSASDASGSLSTPLRTDAAIDWARGELAAIPVGQWPRGVPRYADPPARHRNLRARSAGAASTGSHRRCGIRPSAQRAGSTTWLCGHRVRRPPSIPHRGQVPWCQTGAIAAGTMVVHRRHRAAHGDLRAQPRPAHRCAGTIGGASWSGRLHRSARGSGHPGGAAVAACSTRGGTKRRWRGSGLPSDWISKGLPRPKLRCRSWLKLWLPDRLARVGR